MNKKAEMRAGVTAPILHNAPVVPENPLQWLLDCIEQERQAEEQKDKSQRGSNQFGRCLHGSCRSRSVDAARPCGLRDPRGGNGGGAAGIISFSCVSYDDCLLSWALPAPLCFLAAARCAAACAAALRAAV